ncbi:MAG: hypothetical protein ACE5RI_05005 [Candidatus Nitrosomaritimum yanchengensis]
MEIPDSIIIPTTPDLIFPRLQNGVASVGHTIKSIVPNQTIISEGKRDFSTVLMVILILFLWPAAIIYYFHSKRSSLTIVVTDEKNGRCKITVNSNGKDGEAIKESMFDKLQKEYENP